jgi:membrane fusion protein, multidrug efflux system
MPRDGSHPPFPGLAPTQIAPPTSYRSRALAMPAILLLCLFAAACSQTPPAKDKTPHVVATTPITDDVVDYQDFTGRVEAHDSIDVRARSTGYLTKLCFKDGDPVKEGDVLFEIDPRPYEAQLNQDQADLAKIKAIVTKTEALYRRSISLSKIASSQEDIDTQKGDWEVAKAAILQAEAKIRLSQLNLDWTKVTAPISGRVSRRYVDPGNLVKADDTVLTTIVSDDHVYVYFDVDERSYLDLIGETPQTAESAPPPKLKLKVMMRLANSEEFTHTGAVDFVDNRIHGNTGTIRMRAVFANPRDTIKAGLFARIRVFVGKPFKTILIPDEALQSDQGRKYVYVVTTATEKKEDGTEETHDIVEYRPVVLGQAIQGLREIKEAKRDGEGKIIEGVVKDERVIINGMQRVRPKTVVHVTMEPPPKPPRLLSGKLAGLFDLGTPPKPADLPPIRSGGQ